MPEHNNSHGELLPGAKYARGGQYHLSSINRACRGRRCSRPIYEDDLCIVHYGWKEHVKPEMHYPELEGHKYPPLYFDIL